MLPPSPIAVVVVDAHTQLALASDVRSDADIFSA